LNIARAKTRACKLGCTRLQTLDQHVQCFKLCEAAAVALAEPGIACLVIA
jgi:hypothetical protein